jgi:hypothetical protein
MLDMLDPALLQKSTQHPNTWDNCAPPACTTKLQSLLKTHQASFFKLLEVRVEDLIGATHSDMVHAMHAMLHGIHLIFPPSSTGVAEDASRAMEFGLSKKKPHRMPHHPLPHAADEHEQSIIPMLVTASIQGFRNNVECMASCSFGPAGQAPTTNFNATDLAFLQPFNS